MLTNRKQRPKLKKKKTEIYTNIQTKHQQAQKFLKNTNLRKITLIKDLSTENMNKRLQKAL